MVCCVAFLGGINVGGHRVAMGDLRTQVEELGLTDVWTYIASGNVVFDCPARQVARVDERIASRLGERLGFAVPTFVRTAENVRRLADAEPFGEPPGADDKTYVAFLSKKLTKPTLGRIAEIAADDDRWEADGLELWWRRPAGVAGSALMTPALNKAVGAPFTVRGHPTVQKLAAKLPV